MISIRSRGALRVAVLVLFAAACGDGAKTATYCGDGTVDPGEVCDDGNTTSGDGCSADCHSTEACGNSVVDVASHEQCDDGNTTAGDGCSADCHLEYCGNGKLDPGEACDDGNNHNGDGCSGDCASTEVLRQRRRRQRRRRSVRRGQVLHRCDDRVHRRVGVCGHRRRHLRAAHDHDVLRDLRPT